MTIVAKKKLLNLGLLLTSLIGYLEWGKGNHSFLFQVEYELFVHTNDDAVGTLTHPFVVVPIAGQLMLLFTLFQKTPSKVLTLIGLSSLSLIMLFLLFIGIMGMNPRIAGAALPFVVCGVFVLRGYRKSRNLKSATPA